MVLHLIQRTKSVNFNLKQYYPENSAFRPVNKSCLGHCYPVSPWASYLITLCFEFSLLFLIHNTCCHQRSSFYLINKHFVQINMGSIIFGNKYG